MHDAIVPATPPENRLQKDRNEQEQKGNACKSQVGIHKVKGTINSSKNHLHPVPFQLD
jgi:hypothetical protein